jgi:hypothetical protein
MAKILKIMGLPRSGTNVTSLICKLNFNNYVCDNLHYNVDWLGWKHSYPMDINLLKTIEERTNNDVVFIFMYRDYTEWIDAIINRYSIDIGSEFLSYSFGNNGFIFNTPMGGEYYESIEHYYYKRIESYKLFLKSLPCKSIMINFSELKNQKEMIYKIKNKFELDLSQEDIIVVNKQISFNEKITNILI